MSIASHLSRDGLSTQPLRLRTRPQAYCWLDLSMRLYIDRRGFLTVEASTYSILTGRDHEHELFHYDYERDKISYTEAHLQVVADSQPLRDLLTAVGQPKQTLRRLHLPVGGRRFRPALEDVLEFLITEGIVEPNAGWKGVLDSSREEFRRLQLKAAIARNRELATETLRELEERDADEGENNVVQFRKGWHWRRARDR